MIQLRSRWNQGFQNANTKVTYKPHKPVWALHMQKEQRRYRSLLWSNDRKTRGGFEFVRGVLCVLALLSSKHMNKDIMSDIVKRMRADMGLHLFWPPNYCRVYSKFTKPAWCESHGILFHRSRISCPTVQHEKIFWFQQHHHDHNLLSLHLIL